MGHGPIIAVVAAVRPAYLAAFCAICSVNASRWYPERIVCRCLICLRRALHRAAHYVSNHDVVIISTLVFGFFAAYWRYALSWDYRSFTTATKTLRFKTCDLLGSQPTAQLLDCAFSFHAITCLARPDPVPGTAARTVPCSIKVATRTVHHWIKRRPG